MQTNFKNGTLYYGDVLASAEQIADNSVNCVITSPPYWQLRSYGFDGQWGLEPTYQEYLANLQKLMKEVWRILKPDGTVWINLGDSYNSGGNNDSHKEDDTHLNKKHYGTCKADKNIQGMQAKCLMLIPHRFAIDCIDNGWILRNDIVWAKPNCMPESVTDRFSKKHEYMFFFAKQQKYYFDLDSVREKHKDGIKIHTCPKAFKNKTASKPYTFDNPLGKNCGDVSDFWEIPTKPSRSDHYASYNLDLIKKPILAGCPPDGIIYDPFMGTATTAIGAIKYGRRFVGSEGNKDYFDLACKNIAQIEIQETLF
jgi:DNA modification methylase